MASVNRRRTPVMELESPVAAFAPADHTATAAGQPDQTGLSPGVGEHVVSGSGFDKEKRMMVFLILLPALILGSRALGDAVVTLGALFMLYRFASQPEIRQVRAPWFGAALLLWLSMLVLTTPFALFPLHSLAQSLLFIRWPLFALCLSQLVFTSPRRLQLFERAALGWMIFIALDSIFQYVHGADLLGHVPTQSTRLTGPFSKEVPGIYALRLYCMALVGLIGWRRESGGRDLLPLTAALMVLMLVFSLLAGERLVFIAFLGISVVGTALLVVQMRPPRLLLASLLGAVVAAGAGVALWAPRMIERTIVSFGDQLSSFQQTNYYKIFEAAGMLWEKRPLTGIGSRAYNLGCEQFHYAQLLGDAEGCAVHPHNIYLQWLTENGIIGLGLFLLMLLLIFRQVLAGLDFRRDPLLSGLVLLAPLAIFWPLITSMSMQDNNYSSIVWLSVAWALSRQTRAA